MEFVKQDSNNDCGVACMAMIYNHFFKKSILTYEIKENLNLGDDVLSFFDLINIGSKYNLKASPFACETNMLSEQKNNLPIICQVQNEVGYVHFVIVIEMNENLFKIADPSKNKICKIPKQKFLDSYLGNILIFKKGKFVKNKLDFKFEFKIAFKHIWWIILLFSLTSAINTLLLYNSLFVKSFSNWFTDTSNIWNDILVFSLLSLLTSLLFFAKSILFKRFKVLILQDNLNLIKIYFKNMSNEEFCKISFHKKENHLQKSHIYTLSFIQLFYNFPNYLLFMIFLSFMIIEISVLIFLILITFIFLEVFLNFITLSIEQKNKYKQENKKQKSIKIIYDFLSLKNKETEKITKEIIYDLQENLKNSFEYFFSKISYFVVMLFSYYLIKTNQIDYSDVLFLTIISFSLNSNIKSFFKFSTNIILNKNGKKYLNIFLKTKSIEFTNLNEEINSIRIVNLTKNINEIDVLENYNLTIKKNTFIKNHGELLLKILGDKINFYTGKITFNNIDIKIISKESLSKRIKYFESYSEIDLNSNVLKHIVGETIDVNIFKEINCTNILKNNNINLFDKISSLDSNQKNLVNFLSLFFTKFETIFLNNPLPNFSFEFKEELYKKFLELNNKKAFIVLTDLNHDYSHLF